jgi:hypothetical protein
VCCAKAAFGTFLAGLARFPTRAAPLTARGVQQSVAGAALHHDCALRAQLLSCMCACAVLLVVVSPWVSFFQLVAGAVCTALVELL